MVIVLPRFWAPISAPLAIPTEDEPAWE